MPSNRRPSTDASFLASRVPLKDNLYVLGPFAARVSFSSQQRRALNLVLAIDEDLKHAGHPDGLKGKNIAVVGEGLAGVTCSVALASFDANVWVFETQIETMEAMIGANHRDIHPAVNFWPQESLEVATMLPFFNWSQNSCDAILVRIREEWKGFATKHRQIRKVWPQHTVTGIKEVPNTPKWRLELSRPAGVSFQDIDFDVVIFSTGFGPERDLDKYGTPGYWSAFGDRISRIREFRRSPCNSYIVSGTGDGGIIEVLRLLFKEFRAGRIEASTTSIFRDPTLQSRIKSIERAAEIMMVDTALHEEFPVLAPGLDKICDYLWNEYAKLIQQYGINNAAEAGLAASLSPAGKSGKVVLIGLRSSPLELSASPYHKVLLTHAILKGYVEYFQISDAKVELSGGTADANYLDIKCRNVSFQAKLRLASDGAGGVVRQLSPPPSNYTDAFYVCRHGYDPQIHKLLVSCAPDIELRLRRQQMLYSEHDWLSDDQIEDYANRLKITPPSNKRGWADKHYALANEYFTKHHGVQVKPAQPQNGKFAYLLDTGFLEFNPVLLEQSREMIPATFVGVPVNAAHLEPSYQADDEGHPA